MAYTPQTPILGEGRGDFEKIWKWARENNALRTNDVYAYLAAVYQRAPALGINPDVVVAQSILETSDPKTGAPWASYWWEQRRNPAGIGITGDPTQNDASQNFITGYGAARAQLMHLWLYTHAEGATALPEGFSLEENVRYTVAQKAGRAGTARTIDDLSGTWAADPIYGKKISGILNRMEGYGFMTGTAPSLPTQPLEDTPMALPRVLLVAGHRSIGDGGSPTERALTDDLARAYKAAFKAAGYTVEWLQEIDGDNYPDMTAGGLDGVARACGKYLSAHRDETVWMLDLHFNTTNSPVHSIVAHNMRADGRGMLSTAYSVGRVAEDVFTNNGYDVRLAELISREIVATIPGMRMWNAPDKPGRVDGVMLENETGVGNNDGSAPDNARLAMMSATAGERMHSVRITVEHGGTNDATKPKFFELCAAAAVKAGNAILKERNPQQPQPEPQPEPEPEEPDAIPPIPVWAFGSVQGYAFDATGVVTKAWIARSESTGTYPRLIDVLTTNAEAGERSFLFSDGSIAQVKAGAVTWFDHSPANVV